MIKLIVKEIEPKQHFLNVLPSYFKEDRKHRTTEHDGSAKLQF